MKQTNWLGLSALLATPIMFGLALVISTLTLNDTAIIICLLLPITSIIYTIIITTIMLIKKNNGFWTGVAGVLVGLIIILGGLSYLGFFDHRFYQPMPCQMERGVACDKCTLIAELGEQQAIFTLRNEGGDTIFINQVSYKKYTHINWTACEKEELEWEACTQKYNTNWTICKEDSSIPKKIISNGEETTFTCNFEEDILIKGEKQKIELKIIYSRGGTAYDPDFKNIMYGHIYDKVK